MSIYNLALILFYLFCCVCLCCDIKIKISLSLSQTLKKAPTPFSNPGYGTNVTSEFSKHMRLNETLFVWAFTGIVYSNLLYWRLG